MKKIILSLLKYLTLPFALLYGLIVFIRNKFYDLRIFNSIHFDLPVICVGNITVGGTGKSPHIEYLIELLSNRYKTATLSRGYRRYSRGFRIANSNSDAREIGDEPFQYKSKYPQVTVCVAEERMTAIPSLLQQKPETEIVLLDDAFQHRSVRAGMNILLTDHERLYTRDYILPFGLLRESRSASKRADVIVITKCPPQLTESERIKLKNEINPLKDQPLYFSAIKYKEIYPLTGNKREVNRQTEVLLVTGIANAAPLTEHLKTRFAAVYHLAFKDHHYFTFDDLKEIQDAFEHIRTENKIIVTTEKDASRLMLLSEKIGATNLPFYAQPIGVGFLFGEEEKFNSEIIRFIETMIPPLIEDIIAEENNDPEISDPEKIQDP